MMAQLGADFVTEISYIIQAARNATDKRLLIVCLAERWNQSQEKQALE